MLKTYFLVFFILCWTTTSVVCQNIVTDSDPTTGLGSVVDGVAPNYTILGGNIPSPMISTFHSFSKFTPANGDTVTFDPQLVESGSNLILRDITAGPKTLAGSIHSNLASNFIFLTSNALTLGPNLTFDDTDFNSLTIGASEFVRFTGGTFNSGSYSSIYATPPQTIGGTNYALTLNSFNQTLSGTGNTFSFMGSAVTVNTSTLTGNNIFFGADANDELNLSTGVLQNSTGTAVVGDGIFTSNASNYNFLNSFVLQSGNATFVGANTIARTNNTTASTVTIVSGGVIDLQNTDINADVSLGSASTSVITLTAQGNVNLGASGTDSDLDVRNTAGYGSGTVNITSNAGNITFYQGSDIFATGWIGTQNPINITATAGAVVFNQDNRIDADGPITITGNSNGVDGKGIEINNSGNFITTCEDVVTLNSNNGGIAVNNSNILYNYGNINVNSFSYFNMNNADFHSYYGDITVRFQNNASNISGVNITNGSDISANDGTVDILSPGTITIDDSDIYARDYIVLRSQNLSVIATGSNIRTENNGTTGAIDIVAQQDVQLTNSRVSTRHNSNTSSAANIRVEATNDVVFDNSQIDASSSGINGGNVLINKDQINANSGGGVVTFQNNATINTSSTGTGNGGYVDIAANEQVSFTNQSGIRTQSNQVSGNVTIVSVNEGIFFGNNAGIQTNATSASGTGGSVSLTAKDNIAFNTLAAIVTSGRISGNVTINSTDNDVIFNNAFIETKSQYLTPGKVDIYGKTSVEFTGSYIDTQVGGGNGTGGTVEIDSPGIISFTGSAILTSSSGTGLNAGAVLINTTTNNNGDIEFNNSNIYATSTVGNGGLVDIRTSGEINFHNNSTINTQGYLQGGEVKIAVAGSNDVLFNNGHITTSSSNGTGGKVTISTTGGDVEFSNVSNITTTGSVQSGAVEISAVNDDVEFTDSNIDTNSPNGTSGTVSIVANDTISFDNTNNGYGIRTGALGNVTLTTALGDILFTSSDIDTNSTGANAGNVSLSAKTEITFEDAAIYTDNDGTGNAGSVTITTEGTITFTGGNISAQGLNVNALNGGKVTITTTGSNEQINFSDTVINTSTKSETGNGGDIAITAPGLINFSNISNIFTFSPQVSGKVDITSTTNNVVFNNSKINTSIPAQENNPTFLAANIADVGGAVTITAQGEIQLLANSDITTGGVDVSGKITLNSQSNILIDDSDLNTSAATQVGGDIEIDAEGTLTVNNAILNTSITGNGTGNAGTVDIDVTGNIAFTNGDIQTTTGIFGINGGNVFVKTAGTVLFQTGSAITTAGIVSGGQVDIAAAGSVTFQDASHILTGSMYQAGGVEISSTNAGISFTGSNITAQGTQALSVGGNVLLTTIATGGAGTIAFSNSQINTSAFAQGGKVDVDSTGSVTFENASHITTNASTNAGDVVVTGRNSNILFANSNINAQSTVDGDGGKATITSTTGTVTFTASQINTTGIVEGGAVKVNATGLITFENGSHITANAQNSAGNVTIQSNSAIDFVASQIIARSTVQGTSGQVLLQTTTGDIDFSGNSDILTENLGNGNGGLVQVVSGGQISFTDFSDIYTTANAANRASGAVNITSFYAGNQAVLFDEAYIVTTANNAAAQTVITGGQVRINAVAGEVLFTNAAGISTVGNSDRGIAGEVRITSNTITFKDSSEIDARAGATGGAVILQATGLVDFSSASRIRTLAGTTSGNVSITAGQVSWDGSSINTSSSGTTAVAGAVTINSTGNIAFSNSASIFTSAYTAGKVTLNSTNGAISFDDSSIETFSYTGTMAAGDVDIDAKTDITFSNGSYIDTKMDGTSTGNGGKVDIYAGRNISFTVSDISTTASATANNGGEVWIKTTGGTIGFSDSIIWTRTLGTGNGGRVDIKATGQITFQVGSNITTTSAQTAGLVRIESSASGVNFNDSEINASATATAGTVTVLGSGEVRFQVGSNINTTATAGGIVTLTSNNNQVWFSASTISTNGTTAGAVDINARTHVLFDTNSNINAGTNATTTTGGAVTIDATTGTLTFNQSTISTQGTNAGGLVTANAYSTITFTNVANINTNSTTGDAGVVTINSTNDAVAFTNSTITTGRMGHVNIDAMQNITFQTNANISTASTTGQGGNVTLDSMVGDIAFTQSTITATGNANNVGGTVAITAFGNIDFSNVSDITTGGRDTATTMVSIQSTNDSITFNNSEIITNNFGNVVVNAPGAVSFLSGSHITTTAANAGTVTVRSTTNDVLFTGSNITTGTAGNVSVRANRDVNFTTANITTTSAANSGTVNVLGDTGAIAFTTSNISTNVTAGAGNAGTVDVRTNGSGQTITFVTSAINTANAGTGNGGNVAVFAPGAVDFSSSSHITTTATAGNSGTVTIQSQGSTLDFDNSRITTGMNGTVDIDASGNIGFSTNANIDTRSLVGQGANVTMDSTNGTVTFTQSTIQSSGSTGTTGGTVAINASGTIQFTNVSDITTGGRAEATTMVNLDSATGSVLFDNSEIRTGAFGNVRIEAAQNVQFAALSHISTQGTGQAGNVSVVSQNVGIDFNNSTINTIGTTQGGSVTVNAPGAINFANNAHITTGNNATVSAGVVNITSTNSTINITNSNITTGTAGNVSVVAQGAVGLNTVDILAESENGNGANVLIQSQTDALNLTNVEIGADSQTGNAGNITLITPTVFANFAPSVTLNSSAIGAVSNNANGGTVSITTRDASIYSSGIYTHGEIAGVVDLNISNSLTIDNSEIYAEGNSTNGQILIDTANLSITNSVLYSGAQGEGIDGVLDINMTTNNVATLQNSELSSNTIYLRGRFNALNGSDGVILEGDNINIYNQLTSRNGLAMTGTVNVLANAELRSAGQVTGTLNNLGRFAPEDFGNNNIADFDIEGTFTNGATGTLEINLTPAGDHDRVVVDGNINLNNRLDLLFNPNDVYVQGTTFDIIPFTGVRTGEFTWYHGINNEPINPNLPLLRFQVRYLDDQDMVQVYVYRSFFERLEYNDPRAEALAKSLEPIANEGGGEDLRNIMDILDRMTAPQVQAALVQMGSESYDGLGLLHFQNTQLFTSALLGQLQGVGHEATGDGLASRSRMDNMILLAYEGDVQALGVEKEEPRSSSDKSVDVFVQFLGGMGEQDSVKEERTGFDYRTMGFVAGINFIASDSVSLGLHGAYTMTEVDFDDLGDSDADTTGMYFGAHARLTAEKLFFNLLAGYAYSNYEYDRRIIFTGVDRTAKSDFDGHSFYGTISAGYDFEFGEGLVFTPVTSLNYVYQMIEKVKEKNAGDLNMVLDDRDIDSFRMGLGFRLAYRIKSESVTVVPEMRFMWLHEFLNDADEIETVLAGNPDNPAYIPTSDPERNLFRLGVQISTYLSENFLLKFEYDAELQRDYVSHLGKATLSISF